MSEGLTDQEWRERLTPEEYRVMRQQGTERPFTSGLNSQWSEGTYVCKGCDRSLFDSESKFDSGCGWPSFDAELPEAGIRKTLDRSHGMIRTELSCASCGSHLGHVFPDGPTSTGLRYCINGVSLRFGPESP
ncbi:MAG: peptide-methionine (R)-S-oxide reductase MsrB [Bacteroidetes bacterium]|nr:peptide-methionine (R)-S-oxide reductase MsrB [Bacteroidota bacterium]MDA0903065.1 peptide-methionine (R)-S-oxide reductase MsrB [Bacteroidota bacterium]MDA1241725.1 peptide-methionine (R)-S-oxide reductase MsrB [Bacteroidota bacterium]